MTDIKQILSHTDHTLLRQDAVWEEYRAICDQARTYRTASVCVPPCFVRQCREYLNGEIPVCTVIGFPNGYSTTECKIFETENALKNGADEIDLVVNLSMVRSGAFSAAGEEISRVRAVCPGKILKVIVETCLLSEEEKIALCSVVHQAGADYIKTSTGFSSGGATREDVALLVKYAPSGLKVKASGGIATLEDAEAFLALGAQRLGTSRIVGLIRRTERG